LMCALNAP